MHVRPGGPYAKDTANSTNIYLIYLCVGLGSPYDKDPAREAAVPTRRSGQPNHVRCLTGDLQTTLPNRRLENSTGAQTRVAGVRAGYPNQLGYSGFCNALGKRQRRKTLRLIIKPPPGRSRLKNVFLAGLVLIL